jgi:type I restriction enzyme S subunit
MSYKKYKLKDLVDNFSVRARDYGGSEGLDFLGVSNDDGIVKSKSAAEHKGEEYKIIEKGCFAYNPYRINIGSIAYHNEDVKGLISPAYVIFKTKPNSIKDNLLFKFLKSAEGLRQIRFHGRGTVRQALRFEDLCKIEISLPTFEEQEKLISNIEKTEFESNLISSELTHQLDLIKQLRQAFLREAMQGKLVKSNNTKETGQQLLTKIKTEKAKLIADKKLKKEKELPPITEAEIPFDIPKHWTWCRLGEIINISSGDGLTATQMDKNGTIPVYGGNGINGYHNKYIIDKETIVIGRVGYYCGCVHLTSKYAWVTDNAFIVKYSEKNINRDFLIQLLKWADLGKQQFAGSQPVISGQRVYPKLIPFPPLHEQEQIVAKLEELMAFCEGLEQSIKESQGYNEMLLQQVLREALQGK